MTRAARNHDALDEMSDPTVEPRQIPDATCLACGCLCDDIVLTVQGERIVEARHACPQGRAWFVADHAASDQPEAALDGQPVEREHALTHAAQVLREARAAIVTGLDGTTVEAQRLAVTVADMLGAVLDPIDSARSAPALAAFQRVGRVAATLGEVRNRADLVVFWGVDPATTHRRHFERYSVEPHGRFVPGGRAARTILVADHAPTATAALADGFLQIPEGRWFEVLWALRALVRGIDLDPDATLASTGIPHDLLQRWAERLAGARYGALFFGPGPGPGGSAQVEALQRLVRDLNDVNRFVALPIGGPGNPTGAEAVTTWQTGFAQAVDFARGYPRFLPGEATADARLAQGAADAALIVGPVDLDALSPAARAHLERIPTVVIGPAAAPGGHRATVALKTATPGIHTGGTVVRADGAWLPLRPALASRFPTDAEWLELLLRHLAADPNGGP